MAPPVKITYFNSKGLAEPIRFILSYAGEEFIDEIISRENWAAIKPNMPFGKVPVMEIGGKVASQSVAICRYFAKKAGIAGENDWDALLIDATVDTVSDLVKAITLYYSDENEDSKEKKYQTLIKETVPFYMQRLNQQVENNGGYFVNNKLSWADLYFSAILETLNLLVKIDLVEGHSHLQALKDKVFSLPAIKTWVAKRPATEY